MNSKLKATFLVATLKPDNEVSHTEALSRLLAEKLKAHEVESEIVRLAERNIPLGTQGDMGKGDEWPEILKKLIASDIIIFATPVWFGSYSSLLQKIIERMDSVRGPEFTKNGKSPFNNKVGGVVVTGGQDGAEAIIGHIAMFMSWIGLTIPPAYSLTFLSGMNFAEESMEVLIEGYKKDNDDIAGVTAANLASLAKLLKKE